MYRERGAQRTMRYQKQLPNDLSKNAIENNEEDL